MSQQTQNTPNTADTLKSATARFNMIEQQIRTWEVLDPVVLQLLNDIPREHFVPLDYQGLAFADLEIPIGYGQKMLSPKLEGRCIQSLNLLKTDKVLHVGTGSGYLVALIASLAKHVYSLELEADLSQNALKKLKAHHIENVTLEVGDGAQGWLANAPYDVILMGASSPVEPKGLRQQLTVGGRLFIVLGEAPVMRATLIERVTEDAFKETVLFETCIDPLVNATQSQAFHF